MNKQIEEMEISLREAQHEFDKDWTECLHNKGKQPPRENLFYARYLVEKKGYRKQSAGEWIKDEQSKFKHRYHCSVCNFYLIGAPTKYCEECGAKMKGGEGK